MITGKKQRQSFLNSPFRAVKALLMSINLNGKRIRHICLTLMAGLPWLPAVLAAWENDRGRVCETRRSDLYHLAKVGAANTAGKCPNDSRSGHTSLKNRYSVASSSPPFGVYWSANSLAPTRNDLPNNTRFQWRDYCRTRSGRTKKAEVALQPQSHRN